MIMEDLSKEVTLSHIQNNLVLIATALTDNGISLPSLLHSFFLILKNSDLLFSTLTALFKDILFAQILFSLNLRKVYNTAKTNNKATCHLSA